MSGKLNYQFDEVVKVVNSSGTTDTTSSTTAKEVTNSRVTLQPNEAGDGTIFEWYLAGTKTATNAAHTVTLVGNGTTLLTLTADDGSAVDWVAHIVLRFGSAVTQRVFGTMQSNTTDCECDYATGTVNFTAGGPLVVYVTAGNGSDTVTADMCVVKRYIQ